MSIKAVNKVLKQRCSDIRALFVVSQQKKGQGVTGLNTDYQTADLKIPDAPIANVSEINELLRRYGVKFGIPNLMEAYRSGNVAIINAPGNGVADDKGIYYFVPKMIKYYLGEEPILKNAPTYLPFYEDDRKYVLDNIGKLVIKDVAEAGGYGVVFGSDLSAEKLEEFRQTIIREPRRFIAQEVIDFCDLPIF